MTNLILNYISITIIILLYSQRMMLIYMCLTLCNPTDCSPPGFSVHGILHTSILEWVPYYFPDNLPNSRIKIGSPALQAESLSSETLRKPFHLYIILLIYDAFLWDS